MAHQSKTARYGFATGPAGWNGASLTSKVGNLIGYEEGQLYFLEGANTVQVFNYDLGFVRTDQFSFNGDLAGSSLADVIDGKAEGYTYIGWDLGPVIIGVSSVPEASTMALWLIGGGLVAARVRGKRQARKQA